MMALFFQHKDANVDLRLWKTDEPIGFFQSRVSLHPVEEYLFCGFKSEKRKLEFLAVRYLLQDMCKSCGSIIYTGTGKPLLRSKYGISISHCNGYVAVMLSGTGVPGLDIEVISPRAGKLKQRFLNEQELAFAGDNPLQTTLFWSAKEALFKMCNKQGIDFKTNFVIDTSHISGSEQIKATINKEGEKVKTALQYKLFEKIVLVWGVNHEGI